MNQWVRFSKFLDVVRNSRGQISIFIALIFNILFVFFAMVINVGMLVHDKINLQNSVDLAAYYAAAKQAEQLNAIAHTNYQIRQSWKLLAWRIRAIGDIGRPNHPLMPNTSVPISTADAFYDEGVGGTASARQPVVCIAHPMWADGSGTLLGKSTGLNLCEQNTFAVPPIPPTPVIFPLLGINQLISNFTTQQQEVTASSCQDVGALDWAIAASWYLGYRFDIATKKQAIRTMAQQLSSAQDDFKDVTGASVLAGAMATLQNNLTRANLDGLSKSSVTLYNSLNSNGTGDWTQWLHETNIFPAIYYADIYYANGTSGGCTGAPSFLNVSITGTGLTPPKAFATNGALKATLDPGGAVSGLLEEPDMNPKNSVSLTHSSAGYEKNPWVMAYVGFKATTQVVKPFAPFGGSVQLVARAFAKPFGGRIGPWMYKQWPSGQNLSNGGDLTDTLIPQGIKTVSGAPLGQNFAVPNYSRYPGDPFGLSSTLALAAMRQHLPPDVNLKSLTRGFWSALPKAVFTGGDTLAVRDEPVIASEQSAHPLASAFTTSPPWVRAREIGAVAPDLFDVTYYSIEPNFNQAYISRAASSGVTLSQDIGYHPNNATAAAPGATPAFTVTNQITAAGQAYGSLPYYIIKDVQHLLTGWVNSGAYEYLAPAGIFGVCHHWPGELGVPGCVEGGRTGYSVKLVSKSYLTSATVTSGPGPDSQAGSILNPPPSDF